MTDRKQELLDVEEAAWTQFHDLTQGLSPADFGQPVDDSGWTLKDIVWHLGCWTAKAGRELERIKAGTYTAEDEDTDAANEAYLQEGRKQDLDTVKAEWISARMRAREAWAALDQITPEAEEWFVEIGPEHFDEHLPQVRSFLERRV